MITKMDIHPIQSIILCELLFVKEARFGQLNKKKLSSDQFSFHLRQLTGWKLIEKTAGGKYVLTVKGKEYANRFNTDMAEIERQPKLCVCVVAIKEEGEKTQFLCQQRLKQPYFGFWGFVTGKVRWGEMTNETALRELMEETGLKADLRLIGLRHKMDFSQEEGLLEDKYFLTFRADKTQGELLENFEGGKNKWMTREEVLGQEDVFDDVEEILNVIEKNALEFGEKQYKVKRY